MGKKLLVIGVAGLAVLFFARGAIAKMAVTTGVKAATGLKLEMHRLDMGLFRSQVHVTGMKLHNPAGFPDPIMADVPELYVDADLPALLRGETHLRELRLDFRELLVEKDRQGRTNLDSLTAVKKAKEEEAAGGPAEKKEPGKPVSFKVDKLRLKVEKVVYKDYSRGEPPTVREFPVDIDEEYHNITDPTGLASLILTRALVKTTVANLASFNLGALEKQALDTLRIPVDLIGESAGKTGGEAVDILKGILGTEQEAPAQ